MLENLTAAFGLIFNFQSIIIIILAAFFGLFVGSIPGLTATMAVALLIPITFFMEPGPAIAAIVAMEAMAIFAGDIPGALVRIPGTPSSAAYVNDAYDFTKRGKAGLVLTVDVLVASIGGLIGAIILIVLAPQLAEFALLFSTYEYFWLACIGLSCSVIVSKSSLTKGMISLLIGLLITQVGLSETFGYPRYTFDIIDMYGGISFIPVMIGMFGISEIVRNVTARNKQQRHDIKSVKLRGLLGEVFPILKKYKFNIFRSGLLGTLVGILPGAGADIAAWIAYAVSKKSSKHPEKYGTGHIEGIVDAGTANNAALGGTWIPALIFGIPGDSITAVVIGVLLMKGIRPGPMIFEQTPEILYTIYIAFILSNIILIPLGMIAIKTCSQILRIPKNALMPIILMFCLVGAFAINNAIFDVCLMVFCGVLAFFMEDNDIPVAPAILGIVLGRMLEDNFMQSMIKSDWNFTAFFSRPVACGLGILAILLWMVPLVRIALGGLRKKQ